MPLRMFEDFSRSTSSLNRIDLDEMQIEENRLRTFNEKWPHNFITGKELAKAGFFFTKVGDCVRCAFCGVTVGKWEPHDDAFEEHKKWEPRCRFVQGIDRKNVPLRRIEIDDCGHSNSRRTEEEIKPKYKYPFYSDISARLDSFKEWPINLKQRPEDLANAGLFYTGNGDHTICFHCGEGLRRWEENDIPWVEHANFFPDCPYVIAMKYKERLGTVDSQTTQQKPIENASEPSDESAAPEIDDNIVCTLCYSQKRSVLFLPCKHLLSCGQCSTRLDSCPLCRSKLEGCIKVQL